jgi:hypothetical protein
VLISIAAFSLDGAHLSGSQDTVNYTKECCRVVTFEKLEKITLKLMVHPARQVLVLLFSTASQLRMSKFAASNKIQCISSHTKQYLGVFQYENAYPSLIWITHMK